MKKGVARRAFALFLAVVLSVSGMGMSVNAQEAQYGSKTVNLAKGKDAYASSNQRGSSTIGITKINNLTDGNKDSYIVLHSEDPDPWYYVDLGKVYSVNKVVAYQGKESGGDYSPSYAKRFAIEYTQNLEEDWQEAAAVTDGVEGENAVSFDPVDARYVRFRVDEKAGDNSLLYEFEVYETDLGGDDPSGETGDVMKILFIGNSLTYYNDVPGKVKALFAHDGKEVEVDSLIQLGQPLTHHASLPETKEKILTGDFDYVVLQDKASGFNQSMLQAGVSLIYPWIEEAGSQLVLYMPWANESVLADGQTVFTNAYVAEAKSRNALLAPSGEAYYELYFNYDKKWYSDNIHGNDLASFVSASTIYYTISGKQTPIVFTESDEFIRNRNYDVETTNLIQAQASRYTEAYRDLDNIPDLDNRPIVPQKKNLAKQKTGYASSNERGDGTVGTRVVNNLTDGSTSSFIVLNEKDTDPWFAVDLGEKKEFNKVVLYWGSDAPYEDSYRTKFTVEGSDSLEEGYQVITSQESVNKGKQEIGLGKSEYRFVRIHVTEKLGTYCGLYELEVYNEENSEEGGEEEKPSETPSEKPSEGESTEEPSETPSEKPSEGESTEEPSEAPSETPSEGESTEEPSETPSEKPSEGESTEEPSETPSEKPSEGESTEEPSETPSENPSEGESTEEPTEAPSETPSEGESTEKPSEAPSEKPSENKSENGGIGTNQPSETVGAVSGLKISKKSATKFKLSWSKVEGASYKIVLATGKKTVKTVMTAKTSYTFKKLKSASVYKVSVQAYKTGKNGLIYGNPKTIAAKTAPAKVKIKNVSLKDHVISLSWKKVKGASGYEVYMKKGNGKYKKVKTIKKNSLQIKLKEDSTGIYRFKIRAYTKYNSKKVRGAYVKTMVE